MGWHREVHAKGLCITCWRPNDRLPLMRCAFCEEMRSVQRKIERIAKRLTVLEAEEERLKERRQVLRLEMATRRVARGNKRGRSRKVGQRGPTPALRRMLNARQHPWQQAEDASYAERMKA